MASRQNAKELVLHLTVKPKNYREMYNAVMLSLKQGRNKNVQCVSVIFPDNTIKEYELGKIKQRLKE